MDDGWMDGGWMDDGGWKMEDSDFLLRMSGGHV